MNRLMPFVFSAAWLLLAFVHDDTSWRQTFLICAIVYHAVLILAGEKR